MKKAGISITTSKKAVLEMVNLSALRKITLILGLCGLSLYSGLYLVHYGFDKGVLVSETINVNVKDSIAISAHGRRTYEFFRDKYMYVACLLILFMIAKFIESRFKTSRVFDLLSIILLGIAFYQICRAFSEKELRSHTIFWNQPFDSLLRHSVPFELAGFLFIVLLIIVHLMLVGRFIFTEPRQ